MNLPLEIITNILLRLPIRSIVSCKCVCKKWQCLISSAEFAKSHISISTPGLIVHLTQKNEALCRMFEFDDVIGLQRHNLHYKLLRDFDPNVLSSSTNANVEMLCSVNGLICLREYSAELDTLYICNPIMHEFFSLPGLKGNASWYPNIVKYGIGISASSGEYKVVRIFHEPISGARTDSSLSSLKIECMVYTLGTASWRSLEHDQPYEYEQRPSIGAFLNESLHWLVGDSKGSLLISCFDLETESFNPFPTPFESYFPRNSSLTVLEDGLCLCDYSSDDEIVIWIMKEYGVEESWTKAFVIDKYPDLSGLSYESVHALKVFKDGDVLMLWENTCLFCYCSRNDTSDTEIDLFEGYWLSDAFLHTPSFISLKSFRLENVKTF